jgi:hypothetical protein
MSEELLDMFTLPMSWEEFVSLVLIAGCCAVIVGNELWNREKPD